MREISATTSAAGGTSREMFELVYGELRGIAERCLRTERAGHTLQATALVHEAYLKLHGQGSSRWESPDHFLAVAAQAVRRVLVDHARGRQRLKRGGGGGGEARRAAPVAIEDVPAPGVAAEILHLDDALRRLAALHERHGRVAELRLFGGMTGEQIANVLGVSRTTVADDWSVARAWLASELAETGAP